MSRIGKAAVSFDSKVNVNYSNNLFTAKGPLGQLEYKIPSILDLKIENNQIKVETDFSIAENRMHAGTARSIIANIVEGVFTGFTTTLVLVGVGYRAQVQGNTLKLTLGFSHIVEYPLPKEVSVEMDGTTIIKLKSYDKQVLGQVVSEIRKYRPPEPYKGKGILLQGEQIRRKAGKTAKKGK